MICRLNAGFKCHSDLFLNNGCCKKIFDRITRHATTQQNATNSIKQDFFYLSILLIENIKVNEDFFRLNRDEFFIIFIIFTCIFT